MDGEVAPQKIWRLWPSVILGLVARIALMLYGLWQDRTMAVKYTDIDYHVFTDAARFMAKGESPYMRATYRYTPLLALLLQPNVSFHLLFGKVVFILCDILTGYLIHAIVVFRGGSRSMAVFCAQLWLLNPMPAVVSSRGNAESIIAALVLGALYFTIKGKPLDLFVGSILFASSVHMKIYPVTYSLAIYLFISDDLRGVKSWWSQSCAKIFHIDLWPNWSRILFVVVTVLTFVRLTGLCYKWYGMEFVQETYLYHVTRRDTRHNFSPYFYLFYLLGESDWAPLLSLLVFIPQMGLIVLVSFRYCGDLPFTCFAQTFIFVTFNKVCTSQYFLWYLSLLPLVLPRLYMSPTEGVLLIALWFGGQGLWLAPAYYLEFEGRNTFILIWAASLVFFCINVWILHRIIKLYDYQSIYSAGQLTAQPPRQAYTVEDFIFKLWLTRAQTQRHETLKSR